MNEKETFLNFLRPRVPPSTLGRAQGQKIKKSFFLVIIFFLIGFFLINQPSKNLRTEDIKYVKIAGQNIKVELALTREELIQGLSGRKNLNNNAGMLFVFEEIGYYPFWMKDMNFSIDIIWISSDLRIVYIKKDARPELYPETYGPKEGVKYVLEVISGFADKNNFKIGDRVEFTY